MKTGPRTAAQEKHPWIGETSAGRKNAAMTARQATEAWSVLRFRESEIEAWLAELEECSQPGRPGCCETTA